MRINNLPIFEFQLFSFTSIEIISKFQKKKELKKIFNAELALQLF